MQNKLLFLFVLSLFINHTTIAQFQKGDKMVGASVASAFLNSGTSEQTVTLIGSVNSKINTYNINLSPSIGWFISDKTVVGGSLTINPSSDKRSYNINGTNTFQKDEINNFNIGLGAFVRNYFGSAGSFMPFGQINLSQGISNLKKAGFVYLGSGASVNKETYSGKSTGGSFYSAGVTAGFTKMMGDNAGLDFFIGYAYSYNKDTYKKTTLRDVGNNGNIDETLENETATKFTNHGFQFGIGFQIFLRKK